MPASACLASSRSLSPCFALQKTPRQTTPVPPVSRVPDRAQAAPDRHASGERRPFADMRYDRPSRADVPALVPEENPVFHSAAAESLSRNQPELATPLQPAYGAEPALGTSVFQMPPASDALRAVDAEDRYQPSAPLSFSDDYAAVPSRSRGVVIMAWTGWVAAAGLAAATVLMVRSNAGLHEQLHAQQAALTVTEAKAANADLVLQTLESAASERFVLARQDTAPVPSARVAYLAEHGSLVFQGTNLEPLPAYKTYELWLIPSGEGRQPIAAGTFKPDNRGYATLVMPSLPKGTVAGNFGVTIEDETGSTTPTLPILLIGQQS